MGRRSTGDVLSLLMFAVMLVLAVMFLIGCGGSSVTGTDEGIVSTGVPALSTPTVAPPPYMDGFFATPRNTAHWVEGKTYIVVPSWSDDVEAVKRALVEKHAFAFVSAHHCFGGKKDGWADCWARTREGWVKPIASTGRLLGVYVVDEPMHNGISSELAAGAVSVVAAQGYATMVAEAYPQYARVARETGRPVDYGADWFGLTAYNAKPEWLEDRMHENPKLNVVFSLGTQSDEFEPVARKMARGMIRWSLDMGE